MSDDAAFAAAAAVSFTSSTLSSSPPLVSASSTNKARKDLPRIVLYRKKTDQEDASQINDLANKITRRLMFDDSEQGVPPPSSKKTS